MVHSFCDSCIKTLLDRDITPIKTCFTRRTPTKYFSANQKTITEIGDETKFFISKSVLAIVDCRLDQQFPTKK